jgi:thiamine biosynthesis protein ThiI
MENNRHTIVVHYSEIALKGKNRAYFEEALAHAIKTMLTNFVPVARKITGRIIVECSGDQNKIAEILAHVFGVKHFSFARVVPAEMVAMKEAAATLLAERQPDSFRITATRSEKNYPFTSQELAVEVGAHLHESTGTRVDLHHPALDIHIEAVEGRALVYGEKIPGPDGLPFGVSGKIVSLISGGFDSPVASWRMMRRGCRPVFVHFHSYPQTGRESIENVERIVAALARFAPESLTLHLVPFLEIQKLIVLKAPLKYAIILYRRAMLRLAETIARREDGKALVTGDSVGQVASQTLDNIAAISATVRMPILRPLAGNDKEEIIALARRIGTHDLSAKPFDDCCSLFTAGSPETHAKLAEIEALEAPLLEGLAALYEKAIAAVEIRSIT